MKLDDLSVGDIVDYKRNGEAGSYLSRVVAVTKCRVTLELLRDTHMRKIEHARLRTVKPWSILRKLDSETAARWRGDSPAPASPA